MKSNFWLTLEMFYVWLQMKNCFLNKLKEKQEKQVYIDKTHNLILF